MPHGLAQCGPHRGVVGQQLGDEGEQVGVVRVVRVLQVALRGRGVEVSGKSKVDYIINCLWARKPRIFFISVLGFLVDKILNLLFVC